MAFTTCCNVVLILHTVGGFLCRRGDGFVVVSKSRHGSINKPSRLASVGRSQRPQGFLEDTLGPPGYREDPKEILVRVDKLLRDCEVKDEKAVLSEIRKEHATDATFCDLLDSGYIRETSLGPGTNSSRPVEWIDSDRLALQTLYPLLDQETVTLLREVATQWWQQSNSTSRFTYQRKGNSEAHLVDLCGFNLTLCSLMREALFTEIYPLVQDKFFADGTSSTWTPRVYDALLIRYNATEAGMGGTGAGQPLHRDLGLVSVNIMLNDDFEGGGTLMEGQLMEDTDKVRPLKPTGVGHALIHRSHERHAGAGTTSGVRDILVLFLTATTLDGTLPRRELSARLKNRAGLADDFTEKLAYHRMAVDAAAEDGEAWHFLGFALPKAFRDLASANKLGAGALYHAMTLTPNDARLYNNLALMQARRRREEVESDVVRRLYERSLFLHGRAKAASCDVQTDYDKAILNYGLYLSKLDLFEEAIEVLRLMEMDESSRSVNRVHEDADKIKVFCELRVAERRASEAKESRKRNDSISQLNEARYA